MTNFDSNRRDVLRGIAYVASGLAVPASASIPAAPLANDEAEWAKVQSAYAPSSPLLNLNNAGVSPQPLIVQDAMIRAYRFANGEPDVNMWETLDDSRGRIKAKLAELVDCGVDEIALNRNATEGLCTAIHGIDLKPGDEVLLSDWDYDSMRHAWEQRARRHGVVIKRVAYELMDSDEAIVRAYHSAITSRTKVMHLTHMVHYTGRVLPVQQLCRLARERDIQTIVDAAQSFAQLPLSFRALGCDYLAMSLHKWLCAPFGTGMLIVKAARIEALWPLMAPFAEQPKGIEKIDGWNLGTYSSPAEHAIEPAIDFHNRIGTPAIHARLRDLSRYWVERVSSLPGFRMHTPMERQDLAAVTLFSIDGRAPEDVEKRLREDHGIRVRARRRGKLSGLRVSPHIYTLKADLDRFVEALHVIARA
jgi:selenocysteine lyase/cysteine desulfurase